MTLHVLTLSTLFPDMMRPNFGVFVERQIRELASREGVDVTVIAPLGIGPWPLSRLAHYAPLNILPYVEKWRNVKVYRPRFTVLPGTGGRFHAGAMTRALLPLVRHLHNELPFDVIDASFFYPDGPVAARLARALGIGFSVKARGADIHYWGRQAATRKAVLRAGNEASGLLAVSQAMKRAMTAMGMDEDKIKVHYTGVDLDRFQPGDKAAAKAALGLSGPVILSVGALIDRKGQDILIRALTQIPGSRLLLAGYGPQSSAFKALAVSLGVDDRVGFLGAVPHDQLPNIYNAADVMALPSVSEGLANVWVESLACGTPIVITDVGGAREVLDTPAAGRIVERTHEAFADAIGDVLAHPPDPALVRGAAMRFTWSANGDALHDHLNEIAANRR
ncbi:MAG: glycosyltransferase [Sphingobium sp.]